MLALDPISRRSAARRRCTALRRVPREPHRSGSERRRLEPFLMRPRERFSPCPRRGASPVRRLAPMRIALRSTVPLGAAIRIADSRAMPLDWERWRDALLGGPPTVPPTEEFTAPEGWPVTIAEVAVGELVHVHAFYAILDRAVHAWSAVRAD